MADDRFYLPGPIDMLVGGEIYKQMLLSGRIDEYLWIGLTCRYIEIVSYSSLNNSCFQLSEQLQDSNIRQSWELETIKLHLG